MAAAAAAASTAEGDAEGRPDGERKRRRRRRRGRGGSREGREASGAVVGAGASAEAAEGASGDQAPGDGPAEATDSISTADTQPLPILATPPGLPMAYEPPGLPAVAGERDAHAETVTLPARESRVPPAAIPEHPAETAAQDGAPAQAESAEAAPTGPTVHVDDSAALDAAEQATAETAPETRPERASATAAAAAVEAADVTGSHPAPEAPADADVSGSRDSDGSHEEVEPVQRYTVWSSGPGTGSHHFGPKDE